MDFFALDSMWALVIMERYNDQIRGHRVVVFLYLCMNFTVDIRLIRIFRFLKTRQDLKILIVTLKISIRDILIIMSTFLVLAVVFASAMYTAEFFEADTYASMFVAIWWAIVTMTTVGYGDIYPKSPYGFVVASVCAITGVIFMAMPIAVVASKFDELRTRYSEIQEHEKRIFVETKKQKVAVLCVSNKTAPLPVNTGPKLINIAGE